MYAPAPAITTTATVHTHAHAHAHERILQQLGNIYLHPSSATVTCSAPVLPMQCSDRISVSTKTVLLLWGRRLTQQQGWLLTVGLGIRVHFD